MGVSRKKSLAPEYRVAGALARHLGSDSGLTLAYSGGLDSSVLLQLLVGLQPRFGYRLSAAHVHHGLSPNADAWAAFCEARCAALGVPLKVIPVRIEGRARYGVEAAARQARYAKLLAVDTDFVALAQHRDDQAETVLLQLLRGSGPAGLAGMPEIRRGRPALLRPLLECGRDELEAYAREQGLEWVDDESNRDTGLRRNFLRHRVMPLVREGFPQADDTLARSARHLAECQDLLDELGHLDAGGAIMNGELNLERLAVLSEGRAKNLLRMFLRDQGVPMPGERLLTEALRQLTDADTDADPMIALGPWRLRRYRGRVRMEQFRSAAAEEVWPWRGEPELGLGMGRICFREAMGKGLDRERLLSGQVHVRLRAGGEKLQPDCRRPRRRVKSLLRESGIAPGRRELLPFLFVGEELVWVAGLGYACDWQAGHGRPGIVVEWRANDLI
jgi:tRNA(Ile)-lysidine synthase